MSEQGWPKAKIVWTQTEYVKRVDAPIDCFLDLREYAVFTFSANFAYQLLSLRSMEKLHSMEKMSGWEDI